MLTRGGAVPTIVAMMRQVTEFIGTFFLVLTFGLGSGPIGIGFALMVMVYMGGHVSGAHYNPAVTLGIWLRKKITSADAVRYVAAQLLGALGACIVVNVSAGHTFAPVPSVNWFRALILEAVYTFALVLVVLNVAVSARTQGNSYFGLAIGCTVMAGAFAAGGLSGGAFNPAVGVVPTIYKTIAGSGNLLRVLLYIAGPCAGAALAAFVFNLQEQD
jgi:aquaporin Z